MEKLGVHVKIVSILFTPQWCKSHFNSQKHQNWKTLQQKEHIKKHGHCISAEQIVDQQSKEIRER